MIPIDTDTPKLTRHRPKTLNLYAALQQCDVGSGFFLPWSEGYTYRSSTVLISKWGKANGRRYATSRAEDGLRVRREE